MSKAPIASSRDAKSIDRNNFNILNSKKNHNTKNNSSKIQVTKENLPFENSDIKPKTPNDPNAILNTNSKNININNPNNLNSFKESEKEKEKKFFKFQNMSKLIVNKIDDILGSYSTPGYASSSIGNYSDTLGLSKNILNNIESNLYMAEENELLNKFSSKNLLSKNSKSTNITNDNVSQNTPSNSLIRKKINSAKNFKNELNNNNQTDYNKIKDEKNKENNEKQKKEINEIVNEIEKEKSKKSKNSQIENAKKSNTKNPKNHKENNSKNKKDVFMTKVEIEGEIKSSSEDDQKIPYTEDDLFDSSDEDFKVNPELSKEINDFKYMMSEINDLKKGMQNEFDELQYLIKYVDGTSTRVNRHMNGISNLFQQSGLKPKSDKYLHKLQEDSEESDNGNDHKNIYNKAKNMERIKDNLINLQDNFIGYYKNFDGGMKNIESNVSKCKQMLLYEKNKEEKKNL